MLKKNKYISIQMSVYLLACNFREIKSSFVFESRLQQNTTIYVSSSSSVQLTNWVFTTVGGRRDMW